MPSDFQTAQSAVSEAAPILVRPLSADSVAGYTLLKDVYGAPALVLRVDSPRTIYAQGQAALLYFYLALLAVGLVFSLVAMLLADKLILSRLAHLHSSVSQIGASGDLSARVSMTGRDELSSLGNAVDGMLMALEHAELEHRQQEALRSDEERMRHRATQLQAVAEVARAITSVQNLEVLLPQVTHLISDRFGFYHVGVFLLDEAGEYAILKAANSEGGLRMLAREHKLKVGQSGVIGHVTGSGQARIASDVGQDATFFNNPDLPPTLSEMALPLKVRDQIIGALDVQSTHEAAFTDENVTLLNTLADQVAIAIENARSFERQVALVVDNRQLLKRAEKAVEDLNTLTRRLTGEGWRQYLIEQGGELVLEDAHPGLAVGQRALPELDLAAERAELVTAAGDGRSAIAFPIALRGEVIGTLGLEDIEADREWSADEIAVIKDVAEHVALALDNARLFQRTETALAETRRLAQHRQLINQVTTKMRAAMSVDEVLRIAADELRQATRASRAVARLGELAPVDGKGQEGIEGIEETL
jgi:GAF domain-containing protein